MTISMTRTELRKFLTPFFRLLDILLFPFTFMSSLLLLIIRKMRVSNMPVSKKVFKSLGVFPIINHYYEPLFDDRLLKHPLDNDRSLPGIDWNIREQLWLLEQFNFKNELVDFPFKKTKGFQYQHLLIPNSLLNLFLLSFYN